MHPTTRPNTCSRQVKDLRPGNRVILDKTAQWRTVSAPVFIAPNGWPDADMAVVNVQGPPCRQYHLSPDREVVIDKAGMNIGAPMRDVRHADLKRVGDSRHTSECPECGDGVLLMRRSPSSGKLQNSDFCTLCGQAFWYTDLPNDVLVNAEK